MLNNLISCKQWLKLGINSLLICCMFLLTSCSLFSPVKIKQTTYVLNRIPYHTPRANTHHATLLIATPETKPVYNTTQMAYTIKPYQVAYFSENQWAETPSQMLQPLLVQAMQNTHYFHAVVTPPFMGRYDYTLNTQILELIQDYTYHPAVVLVKIEAQLLNGLTNRVIATKEFFICKPIICKTPYGGVIAANLAVEVMLNEIVTFTLENMHR